jgi:hypothetical protein
MSHYTYMERCDLCGHIKRCVAVFCTDAHRHDVCMPCVKAAEARGQAIEVRMALHAVSLDPRDFGMPFSAN